MSSTDLLVPLGMPAQSTTTPLPGHLPFSSSSAYQPRPMAPSITRSRSRKDPSEATTYTGQLAHLPFLGQMYHLAQMDKIDAALRLVFKWCNDQFEHDAFSNVGDVLAQLNVIALQGDILVGWLTATFPASQQLGSQRSALVVRIAERLQQEFGEARATGILNRLG